MPEEVKDTKAPETPPAATPDKGATPPPAAPATPPAEKPGDTAPPPADADKKVSHEAPPEKKEIAIADLKLPEKSLLKQTHVEGIASFAKERGLSLEQTQALLERENEAEAKRANDRAEEQKAHQPGGAEYQKRVGSYHQQLQADKDFGGDGFQKNSQLVESVVQRFGDDVLRKDLKETGLGSYPPFVRLLWRIGQRMAPDTLVSGGSTSPAESKSAAQVMYPNHPSTKK